MHAAALQEHKSGHKTTHWFWWEILQIVGLDSSATSQKYAIKIISEWYKPQEIGEALRVNADTVRRIIHDNNVYIRKSWEYPPK
ncbi:MAG: DUF1810 family protein [Anaerovoracaceae bacterium]